jgi:hypothetical protein
MYSFCPRAFLLDSHVKIIHVMSRPEYLYITHILPLVHLISRGCEDPEVVFVNPWRACRGQEHSTSRVQNIASINLMTR